MSSAHIGAVEVASMRFFDWDHRPAVLVDGKAFAVLRPGAAWVLVDEFDVRNTSADLDEAAWRKRFVGKFGRLDVLRWRPGQDNTPQSKPPPDGQGFRRRDEGGPGCSFGAPAQAGIP
jgi:hypothetical protein